MMHNAKEPTRRRSIVPRGRACRTAASETFLASCPAPQPWARLATRASAGRGRMRRSRLARKTFRRDASLRRPRCFQAGFWRRRRRSGRTCRPAAWWAGCLAATARRSRCNGSAAAVGWGRGRAYRSCAAARAAQRTRRPSGRYVTGLCCCRQTQQGRLWRTNRKKCVVTPAHATPVATHSASCLCKPCADARAGRRRSGAGGARLTAAERACGC